MPVVNFMFHNAPASSKPEQFKQEITHVEMGCVTWQHASLVMFPPTLVEMNMVKVIMLFL